MKELGRGNKRLQHNIVDLYPGLQTQTDEAFKVDGRKHTHTQPNYDKNYHYVYIKDCHNNSFYNQTMIKTIIMFTSKIITTTAFTTKLW